MPLAATILVVLVGVVVIAGLSSFIVRSLRTRPPLDARPAGPPIGSPAHTWLERGSRVVADMRTRAAEVPAFHTVLADADAVLDQLRTDAATVTAHNTAMAGIEPDRLRDQHADLARRAADAESAGDPSAADLTHSRDIALARLTDVRRQIAERDAVLARMQSAVTSLEASCTEIARLGAAAPPSQEMGDSPVTALRDQVHALRAGYAELGDARNRITDQG